jgi:tetratricopeptide (TPR) repeat protein
MAVYAQSQAALQRGDLAKALALSDQLLRLTSYAAQACGWSAWLRLQARQWRQAIDIAQLGVQKDRSASLLGILGQAQQGAGDPVAAESAFREAAAMQPGHAAWKFHLAGLLLKGDREFEAMELFREGVEIEPDPACLFLLAHLELSFNDPASAMEHVSLALRRGQADAMDHTIAARVLMELGRDEEADAHWKKAIDLAGPKAEDIEIVRARFLRELGRFDQALSALSDTIEARPKSARALAMLADSRKLKAEDGPLLVRMKRLADSDGISPAERTGLRYGLGKGLDDLGRYEEAMGQFDLANALGYEAIAARGGFDASKYADTILVRKQIFDGDRFEQGSQTGDPTETPIFVMGMIRSGTTLLERVLTRHPQVKGAGEQKIWIGIERQLVDMEARQLREDVLLRTRDTYLRMLEQYRRDALRVVDKQPGNLLLAGAIHLAFPNARIVYLHRDPLDNAISIWGTYLQTPLPFLHNKPNLVAALQQHAGLMEHWTAVLPADRFMTLPYESLVQDRESSTRRVLEFCGLPWDDSCLHPEHGSGKVITPSLWQVRQPVYLSSIGRWRHYEPWLGEFKELQ